MSETDVKRSVQEFYDRVGWQVVEDGRYQNARYEDLRPVSADYIRRCHLRVKRWLKPRGRFLLDAGSGPVQYPEYLAYSEEYKYRVCVDISLVALQEAQRRLKDHGLYVVADVANLPFKSEPFEGVVSLHTLHHLPLDEQTKAYGELYRVLAPGCTAVVVNGWTDSPLMRRALPLIKLAEHAGSWIALRRGRTVSLPQKAKPAQTEKKAPVGTFIRKLDAAWLHDQIGGKMNYQITPWRSVSVRFLRALVHAPTGGKVWLRLLFWLEERFPRYFGEQGQYPMIVINK